MAIAFFPNRIVQFPTHRNLLDDVDATHINSIQSELEAVMKSLGTSPQIYNDIQTDYTPSTAIPLDEGGISDDDTLFNTILRYYDPKIKPIDHGSVGARLDDIERGKQFHSFALRATSLDVSSSSVAFTTRPKGIRFPKPSAVNDPFDMHNGMGVTLRKSGFWLFTGTVAYTLLGTTTNANNGVYQGAIDWDGTFIDSLSRSQETGSNTHPVLQPIVMGQFTRGTRVTLRTSHNSGRLQRIRSARLSGVCLRETIN